ncbi:Hypothetical protein HDN1F_10430 [gamma proteobacterium HdN1]|nr:Hypothetical protein HDN1F_10430 [gamma proteobacterium HdN1]
MAKLQTVVFWVLVAFFGLLVGVFKFQNDQSVLIDSLFTAQPLDLGLGNALAFAFFIGLGVGILLLSLHWAIQKLENRALRRKVAGLEKQLERTRDAASK